jgi:5-hydroxyisourate hydrolase-like protein (transthyretin family)
VLALLPACCPVPWPTSVLVQPRLELDVLDAESGGPIAGADVHVVRWHYPHTRPNQLQRFTTDHEGRLRLAPVTETEISYPLMMHGVRFHNFAVCVEARGYLPEVLPLPEERPAQTVRLARSPQPDGDDRCPPPQALVHRARS